MELENVQYCNVCMKESSNGEKTVYIKAICLGEDVHICTSCIPHVIHGSGDAVKSNTELKAAVK